jgi:adenine/guanine/hypoxanthine permease
VTRQPRRIEHGTNTGPRDAIRAWIAASGRYPSSPTGSVTDEAQRSRGSLLLETRFRLTERQTTPRIEIIAGITTFLAASYLLVVIPSILSTAGIDRAGATTTTILLFVGASTLMALYANLPFIVGPGIGGSVIVAISMAGTEHVPWPVGLGVAFWSGILFFILTVTGMRTLITRMVPVQIKLSLSAAIGVFIAVLGFRNAGLVLANARTNALALGDFTTPGAIIALVGLAIMVVLRARKIPGGILLGILGATAVGVPLGVTKLPSTIFSLPTDISLVTLQLDPIGALRPLLFPYLFAFFAAEFFSTMGTTLAVGGKAGLLDENGNMPDINKPFVVDSIGASIGPLFGIPALTALIESAAGAEAGGRTGLTALTAAVCFLLALLLVPVALMIPVQATAPALILIGLSMFSGIRAVDLEHFTEGLPAVLTVLLTLLSNSFGTGIAGGLLSYVLVKVLAGEWRQVSIGMYILAVPLAYYFWTVVGPR